LLIVLGATGKWVTKCDDVDVKHPVLAVSGLFVAASLIRAWFYREALRRSEVSEAQLQADAAKELKADSELSSEAPAGQQRSHKESRDVQ